MVKSLRVRRVAAAATTAVSLVAGASVPTHSSEIQRAYMEHTANCIGLLFSDKDAHTALCLPNTMVSNFVDGSSGSAVAPPPPPVVVVTSSYPSVSSSYPSVGTSFT